MKMSKLARSVVFRLDCFRTTWLSPCCPSVFYMYFTMNLFLYYIFLLFLHRVRFLHPFSDVNILNYSTISLNLSRLTFPSQLPNPPFAAHQRTDGGHLRTNRCQERSARCRRRRGTGTGLRGRGSSGPACSL